MAKVIAQTTTIFISWDGESMKKINDYFLGEEAHWTDKAWFYGFYTTVTVIVSIVIFA